MTTPTIPLRRGPIDLSMLLMYLSRACHKDERFVFHDAAGYPDIPAARIFAEELRSRLCLGGEPWEHYLTIEQQYHVIRITSNVDVPMDIGMRWYAKQRARVVQAQRRDGYLTDVVGPGTAASTP